MCRRERLGLPPPFTPSIAETVPARLELLAALPEDEGGKKKKRVGSPGPPRASSRRPPRRQHSGWRSQRWCGLSRSSWPERGAGGARRVRISSEPVAGARRGRCAPAGWLGGAAVEAMVPPNEIVACQLGSRGRRDAAAHSSELEVAGTTLKGRDLRRSRVATCAASTTPSCPRIGFLD